MSHVFLIGFMGAGKSTVAKLVAERLDRPCVDLDEAIEAEAGRSIAEIFEDIGEDAFRDLETEALCRLERAEPSVVACGGGIVVRDGNRSELKRLGRVIYLKVSAGETLARVGASGTRPLLSGPGGALAATSLLDARESLYSAIAEASVNTVGRTAEQVAKEVATTVAAWSAPREYQRVPVQTESGSYDVVVGSGVLGQAGEMVRAVARGGRVALVSDSNVSELFGAQVGAKLITAGFHVRPLTFQAGEASKNWQVAGEILEALAEAGLDRLDTVVALGGGVVGDLVGFSAAAYLRGVDFVQMPTTLLAQVDSSVGGKTGVDLRAGKNLAGAFKQPLLVIADVDALGSLLDSEWRSGLAEVAKSAVIDGEEFMAWLEAHADALVRREPSVVEEAVVRCVTFKSGVVSSDEKEHGARESLNYGHTLGHAIENVAGYGVIPHGLAVAEGMRFAARLSVELAGASREFVARQDAMLDALGLSAMTESWPVAELASAMSSDKKARAGAVRFVLAESPGSWTCASVADRTIREHLDAWAGSKGRKR